MNPLLLKIILALAPSIEQLIVHLIEIFHEKHGHEHPADSMAKLDDAKNVLTDIIAKKKEKP